MGGGDLNLKKSWHPSTLRNIERVWKAEQKHEAEQQKITQLQKELAAERSREEIRTYAEDQGVVRKKDERLDWMYQGPAAMVNREDYLMGRKIDKSFELLQKQGKGEIAEDNDEFPGSIFKSSASTSETTVDLANKIREDPLFAIMKREKEQRKTLLSNPVRMKQLQAVLKESLSSKKDKKSKKKPKKLREVESSESSSSDSDDSAKIQKRKQVSPETKHRKKQHIKCEFEEHQGSHKNRHEESPHNHKRNRHGDSPQNYKRNSHEASPHNRRRNRLEESPHNHKRNKHENSPQNYKRTRHEGSPLNHRRNRNESPHNSKQNRYYETPQNSKRNGPEESPHNPKRNRPEESPHNHRRNRHEDSPSQNSSREQFKGEQSHYNSRGRRNSSIEQVRYSTDYNGTARGKVYGNNERQQNGHRSDRNKHNASEKKKLSAEEKERVRQEMMNNAKWRDEQREKNVKHYISEGEKEDKIDKGLASDFIRPLLVKAAEKGTVEDRVRQKIFTIQRNNAAMDRNFARR